MGQPDAEDAHGDACAGARIGGIEFSIRYGGREWLHCIIGYIVNRDIS